MRMCAFDLETRGTDVGFALQPFRIGTGEAWITSAAIATDEQVVGRLAPTKDWLRRWLLGMAQTKTRIVGHNIAFDCAWLIAWGLREEVFACDWLDSLLLWRHFTASPDYTEAAPKSYSLKAAVAEYLPQHKGYEKDVDFDADDPAELQKLLEYNKKDSVFTLRLARIFLGKLTPRQLDNALIEAACIPLVAESHGRGIVANRDKAADLAKKLEDKGNLAMVKLGMVHQSPVEWEVLASPAKLRRLLYQDWRLPQVKLTFKGDKPSTDRDVLSILSESDERAALLNEARESKNLRTKFAEGTVNSLDYNGDGRVRPNFRVFSTYSGRGSYSSKILKGKDERPVGVALHQWKRDPEFRDLIEAPEGYTLIEYDFSGQEYRLMAVLSRDTTMLSMCEPGEDGHSYMGAKIGQWDYTTLRSAVHQPEHLGYKEAKNLRQLGKVGNLSCFLERSPVLTNRGYVSIEDVKLDDLLWDGIEWVSHDGVVYQGEREVLTYDGITATPDHEVFVGGRRITIEAARMHGGKIDRAGKGWAKVRIVGGIVGRYYSEAVVALRRSPLRLRKVGTGGASLLRNRPQYTLQKMRHRRNSEGARAVYSGEQNAPPCAETSQRDEATLHECKGSIIQKLWCSWRRVPVRLSGGSSSLGHDEPTPRNIQGPGHRPQGQQRSLRAWKSEAGVETCEPVQQAPVESLGVRQLLVRVWRHTLPRNHHQEDVASGSDTCRDHRSCASGCSGEAQGVARDSGEVRVYDILNAGPRHRFTVNGRIVSNCQYRTSANTLQRVARTNFGLKLTPQEAAAIHATYRVTYPGVPMYWKRQIKQAKVNGYVETLAGRRVWTGYKADWQRIKVSTDGSNVVENVVDNRWQAESTAINYPVQGTGADQKYLSLKVLRDYLPSVEGRWYYELHDGVFVIVPNRYADKAAHELKQIMSNLPYEEAWGVTLPIQFPVDVKLGPTWAQMREVH